MDIDPVMMEGEATGHSSLIHDLSMNLTGKRMATCGTDRAIKVWDLQTTSGAPKYTLTSSIADAHSASVMKLSWACSTYGNILVSCALDNVLKIWQETPASDSPGEEKTTWRVLWSTVIPGGVSDVKFAPRQFGLKLAASSNDGEVQTLTATGMKFDSWEQTRKFEPTRPGSNGNQKVVILCIAWNPSTLEDREMLLIGTDSGAVLMWACETQTIRDAWSPMTLRKGNETSPSGVAIDHASPVTDVAWAPSLGRRYHLVASCSRGGLLYIHKLYPVASQSKSPTEFKAVPVLVSTRAHGANSVWRVSWNLTGTTLASSGDDGAVKLWRQSLMELDEETNEPLWRKVQNLQPKSATDYLANDFQQ
eukprot:TRINITY_DN20759_c0_g1_i1.p1 TRINITY_DN20759_c0_g1~~TRINITY_DN20759_c0_g1_i1.p1  ORF type:complete len:364 (+),score=94.98 TRINITY_DN20759_c0_g1_i1:177-1268(+)